MAFPEPHNYLTVHWTVQNTAENGQFGLRFDGPGPVSQAMVDGAASAVSTWWALSTGGVPGNFLLSFLRLARIGTNGRYVPGTISYDHTYAPAVAGGASSTVAYPLQSALVATLRTAVSHGPAHAGRVYLPAPPNAPLTTAYLFPTATVNTIMNSFGAALSSLSGSDLGNLCVYSGGTPSFPNGFKNQVTQVVADTRPDVQRRRASQQVPIAGTPVNIT